MNMRKRSGDPLVLSVNCITSSNTSVVVHNDERHTLLSDQQPKKGAQKKLKVPVMDNDTRWGSVMDMVEYGLDNRVHIRYVLSRNQRA